VAGRPGRPAQRHGDRPPDGPLADVVAPARARGDHRRDREGSGTARLSARRFVRAPGIQTVGRRRPRQLFERGKLVPREEDRLRGFVGRDAQRARGDVRSVDHHEDRKARSHPRGEESVESDREARLLGRLAARRFLEGFVVLDETAGTRPSAIVVKLSRVAKQSAITSSRDEPSASPDSAAEPDAESALTDLVIITGFSGAGKSTAMAVFEDEGYFCVDNLPSEMIRSLVELFMHSGSKVARAAVVSDVRGGSYFDGLATMLDDLRAIRTGHRVLFLEAEAQTLLILSLIHL